MEIHTAEGGSAQRGIVLPAICINLVFSPGHAECRDDCWARWATENQEWCSWCVADAREKRRATPWFVAPLHERTGLRLVLRCTPFAGPKRVVFPRLDLSAKNGGRRDSPRLDSRSRFSPPCQATPT